MAGAAPPLLAVICGPTGSGKSAFAMRLAERLAPALPVEIVSVDSAQVYRDMDVGTAKPSPAARARIAHHLIDILDPSQPFSAGDFVREARGAIDGIVRRGALPLLVGGTMLYLRALREGLAALPAASPATRRAIDALAERAGWEAVHRELCRVDPEAAARIGPRDAQRLQRALEVHRLTGVPLSQWQRQAGGVGGRYRWLHRALWPASREALRTHLEARFQTMLRAGLLDEVRWFHQRGDLTPQHASMRAVGYRQLWRHCAGELGLEQAAALAITATAQLARRQLTWLRHDAALRPLAETSDAELEGFAAQIQGAAQA
jgi:tRNA dimethylallyltransferase